MLTAGILVMVVSIAVGALALALSAVRSPTARSAGRQARTAMAGREAEDGPSSAPRGETGESPRWLLAAAVLSGAGLVLGLLMVMIASIP